MIKRAEIDAYRQWRRKRKLSIHQLADVTGWNWRTVYLFERGKKADGSPIGPETWHRWKRVCAGVQYGPRDFNWE